METPVEKTAIDVSDSQQALADSILTTKQRAKIYRSRLVDAQRGKGKRLLEFVRAKRIELRGRDTEARRKRAEGIDLAYRALNGDMYGMYDENGQYVDLRQPDDFAYVVPLVIGHFEQAFLQLLKVHPEYQYEPDDANDNLMARVGKICEDLGVKDLKRLMKPLRHYEYHNLLATGESWRYLFQAPNPKSPRKVKRPAYEGVELKGMKEYVLNENRIHVPHPLSMQRDMSATTPEETTFLIERTLVERTKAEYEYECIIDRGLQGITPEMQLLFNLQRSSTQLDGALGAATVGNVHGPGRPLFGGDPGLVSIAMHAEQERHFWDVAEYGYFYCDVPETLPDGRVIPAGTFLGDFAPAGVRLMFCDETVLQLEECEWRKRWTLLRYGAIAGTNAGAGLVKKLLPLNYCINDDWNLGQSIKFTVGHPITAIDGRAVYELPSAGQLLKVTLPNSDDIRKAVTQWPGQRMAEDGTQERASQYMQFTAGTPTVGTGAAGAPDMRAAATATGINAMEQQGADRQLQPVEQVVMADEETTWQIAESIQREWTKEKAPELFQMLVKRYGDDSVKAFFAANLRQVLNCSVKPNTEMPRSMARTSANYMAVAQIIQGLTASTTAPDGSQSAPSPQIMEFISKMLDSMGIESGIGEGRTDRREAEYRLNKLAEIEAELMSAKPELAGNQPKLAAAMYLALSEFCSPLIEPVPDPVADAPRAFMQNHVIMQDVYKDHLFGDQGKSWSPAMKVVVQRLWTAHLAAATMQAEEMQLFKAEVEAQAQALIAPLEAPAVGASPQQEAALASEQSDKDHQQATVEAEAQHQRDQEAADADHQRTQQDKDLDLHRDLVRDAHSGDIQMGLQAAKPQPKGAAA